MRFAGSTMDFAALYRLISVLETYKKESLTVEKIHSLIKEKQFKFLREIDQLNHPEINRKNLIMNNSDSHGHFLSFKVSSIEKCQEIHRLLKSKKVITDFRQNYLRFGFGPYLQDFNLSKLLN